MRRLLALACRTFPPGHRARHTDEFVDTALLVADGSRGRAAREALSLVRVGMEQRVRTESNRPLRDGLWLLAVVLAVVNLAVAFTEAAAARAIPIFAWRVLDPNQAPYPYRPDWWWIALTVAAAGIVLGLALGDRRFALIASVANVGLLAYAVVFPFVLHVHGAGPQLLVLTFYRSSFPVGGQWLAPAVVLALATAAAPLRRLPLTRLPFVVGAVAALVALAHAIAPWGDFVFLLGPLVALVLLTVAFGLLVPRLTVLTLGLVLALAPSGVAFFAWSISRPVIWSATAGCVLAAFVPFARLVRRRLT